MKKRIGYKKFIQHHKWIQEIKENIETGNKLWIIENKLEE